MGSGNSQSWKEHIYIVANALLPGLESWRNVNSHWHRDQFQKYLHNCESSILHSIRRGIYYLAFIFFIPWDLMSFSLVHCIKGESKPQNSKIQSYHNSSEPCCGQVCPQGYEHWHDLKQKGYNVDSRLKLPESQKDWFQGVRAQSVE